jgi:adenylate cyclase
MTIERAKRKLSAILSADVKGYSRLMGEDEVATVRTLKEHRELMSKLIGEYRGRVVDFPGDNLLAEFSSVVDAVESAIEIQRELKAKNAQLPEKRRMEFRIGINLGDVIEEGERIYGDGVNVAARMEGLALPGGVCVSGTVYDHVEDKVAADFEYMGEQAVKNIKKPVRVYRVRMERGVPDVPTKKEATLPDKPSIAVLPFTNMSDDPKQEYFSDGLTEQIITTISKTPKLLVIARNSTFTYKGKPVKVQQVGRELGVRYVLEGSVRRSEGRLRITAQLIDAATGNHLWAEQYDRSLKDVFALQDEITLKVITALQVKLTSGEIVRMTARGTDNLEAFLKASEGGEYSLRMNKADNLKARQLFEEAIGLDPNYAYGYAGLGWTYTVDAMYFYSEPPKKSLEKAFVLAQKAISLDDGQESAHRLMGSVYLMTGQPDKAMVECARAIAVAPNSSLALAGMGDLLCAMGRFREAIKSVETAIRLDPFPRQTFFQTLGHAYLFAFRTNENIEVANRDVNLFPGDPDPHYLLGIALIAAGKFGEALGALDKALSLTQNPPSLHIGHKAVALVNNGNMEEAVASVKELVRSRPDDVDGYLYLGVVLCLLGRHKEALEATQKAATLQLGPFTAPLTKQYLGRSHYFLSQYDRAIPQLQESIKLWPDYVYGHIDLAANYTSAGRLEEGRSEVQEILKISPTITLDDVAKNGYFNFRTADKDRFIGALRNAGFK